MEAPSSKLEAIKCKPILLYKLIAASPLKNNPNIDDSNALFLVKNPEIKPDNTSPLPPTVIDGVVRSITEICSPSDTIFQYPFKTITIPYSLLFHNNIHLFRFVYVQGLVQTIF